MGTSKKTREIKDRKAILSTLWTFVMFNYIYADIAMMIFNPGAYERAAGKMSKELVLSFAALMEVAIAMPLLSRILKYRANRWANIIAGVQSTLWVSLTLVGGAPPPFYVFFAVLEMAGTLSIAWYAWTWPSPETQAHSAAINQDQSGASA